MYDVSVTLVDKSGGNSSVDSYVNATLWTIVFNDPVGDVPGLEVRLSLPWCGTHLPPTTIYGVHVNMSLCRCFPCYFISSAVVGGRVEPSGMFSAL